MSYVGNTPISAAFLTDTFSGNGSTTAFTMSVAPANTSSVIVAITGVLQDPSTYSVSGTTLTFSAAPPTGTSNISVRYLGIPASGVTTTAYRTITNFTATAGQTTFTPASYTVGYIDVYRNGVRLAAADFTATNGTTIVLANPASAGDSVVTESFYVSSVLNAIPATAGSVNSTYIANGAVGNTQLASGAARANWGAGGVLQVVNATGTAALSTSSATPASLGFTASITPTSATSKILVQFYGRVYRAGAGAESRVQIWRGGASIQGGYTVFTASTSIAALQSVIVLDSPATTSSVTYSLYGSNTSGAMYVNPNSADDGIYGFVLMEIAA
jgi:hypothetical protein